MKYSFTFFLSFLVLFASAQLPPAPYGAIPSKRQLAWHKTELYGLIHFTPTTFEGKEWGYGDADPKIFNPSSFDADQIMRSAKEGGLKGIIMVAKHHDGFALWPTKTTEYNISKSPFRNGRGDMVREMERAARKNGLKFGIYCSPWDRNNPLYGTDKYLNIYQSQLRELYSNYGDLFMSWHDGANGGNGFYGGAKEKRTIDNTVYYDWKSTWAITRKLQPDACIFSDIGLDVRWVGNESGLAKETSWATFTPMPPEGRSVAVPGQSEYAFSSSGIRNGKFWMPAECDVPLRSGWFFHPEEHPKTPEALFNIYLTSVGRGTAMDLGLAPDTMGLLNEDDVASLKGFGLLLKNTFSHNLAREAKIEVTEERGKKFNAKLMADGNRDTYWATSDAVKTASINLTFHSEQTFDIISIQEYISLGQRIDSFNVEVFKDNGWRRVYEGSSIGAKRLIKLPQTITAKAVRINITKSPVCITVSEIGLFRKSS